MAKASGFNNAFNSGELSEDVWSRTDLAQHVKGCAEGSNYVGLISGPEARRAGFWDVGATKGQLLANVTRLIAFRRSIDDALMLEFGDSYMRVWNADQSPVLDGDDPYELATPWPTAQLSGLRPAQTGDVMVFCHTDGLRPKCLVRSGATNWSYADYAFTDGPWRPENIDRSRTVTFTGTVTAGGTGTLAASGATFDPGMVGGLFKLRQNIGGAATDAWAAGYSRPGGYNVGDLILSNGRVYAVDASSISNETTGQNPPVHDEGTVSDGAVSWTFVHDGAGVVRITAFTSATSVSATVVRQLPMASGVSTTYWAEGAFSDYRGWPRTAPAVREERMIFAATTAEADKLWPSRTAGFSATGVDMKPGLGTGRVVDDDAITKRVGDDGSRIVWVLPSTYLMVGTRAAELVVTGATIDDPLTPAGTTARGISEYGSEDVTPVKAHKSILHVARGGETLRALSLGPEQETGSSDLSVLASHIRQRGIVELAWTAQPDNLLWSRLGDGGLATFAYHVQEQVYGWNRQAIGAGDWTCESLAVIPGYGGRDALWITARRPKGAGWQRRILVLSKRSDGLRLDAAEFYEGAAAGGVSGLDHLEGETIALMAANADGDLVQYSAVVTDGDASLPAGVTAPYIAAGLPYLSRFESLPLDYQGPGSTQQRRQRPINALVTLRGVACRIGINGSRLEEVRAPRETNETGQLVEKRWIHDVGLAGGTDRDPRVVIECDNGHDLIIYALAPGADVHA